MDGLGDSLSEPDLYASQAGGFDIFSDVGARHPSSRSVHDTRVGLDGLDLNSRSEGWPHMEAYREYLQSGGEDGGNEGTLDFPPPRPRAGNPTLGLRAARSCSRGGPIPGRVGGRSEPLGPGRVYRAPRTGLSPSGRALSSLPSGSASLGAVRCGGRRGEEDDDAADDDVEENIERPQKRTEWKKLRREPLEYLPELKEIFDGVAVDGSSSYVPGQSNFDDRTDPIEEEDEDDRFEDLQPSPMSSNSRKRASSISSTADSLRKKSKSSMVKMMKDYLTMFTKMSAERNEYLKVACTEKKERRSELSASIMQAQQLALDCGVDETSVEYYAVSQICKDDCTRHFFINIKTPEGRLAFLKRYCRQHNLY